MTKSQAKIINTLCSKAEQHNEYAEDEDSQELVASLISDAQKSTQFMIALQLATEAINIAC